MNDKELYKRKKQAQLDQWQAEIDKIKAQASEANADAQLEMNKHLKELEGKVEEGKTKLAQLSSASEDAWEAGKAKVESTWDALRAAVSDVAAKFRK